MVRYLYDGNGKLYSKVDYLYDESSGGQMTNGGTLVGHDTANYGANFTAGRGNVTSIRRWDTNSPGDLSKASVATSGYNTTGAAVWSGDAGGRRVLIGYAEDYKDGNNSRSTLAYPTRVSDPDNFTSKVQYDFYTGAATRTEDPKGAASSLEYDAAGRLTKSTNLVTNAHTEYVYPASQTWVKSFTTINSLDVNLRAYSLQVFDGAGRTRAVASSHPGSVGGFAGQQTTFDVMGRAVAQSVPVEIDENWVPRGDDAQAATNGWLATRQTYDWKGRPVVTTTTDNKTRSIGYEGCGCAGGEVVTTTDEVGRRQKMYSDILGRTVKHEDLNVEGSVYRTLTSSYIVRDQVTEAVQRAGTSGAGRRP